MAAHLFNESGQMQEVDIPDIFDVLEGGEDESAVKFLLGFNADDAGSDGGITITTASELMNNNGLVQQVLSASGGGSLSPPPPMLPDVKSSPARVVVQIEPPNPSGSMEHVASSGPASGGSSSSKTDKPRKREPVDPSRCIYACESCGKAFTTKFNLKRHINMHCSRSREAGVPIQGPPSASQPSRKNKSKDEQTVGGGQVKVRRVSSGSSSGGATSVTSAPLVKTVVKTYQEQPQPQLQQHQPQTHQPMTVQLAVNAQGQLVASGHRTATIVTSKAGGLLPEHVQIIQSLAQGGGQRIVRVINAPQIIATTQSRAGLTTGATVQLQAIPVTSTTSNTLTFPQQPVPLVQSRQFVLTNSLTKMAARVADFMPGIAATAIDTANRVVVTSTSSPADLIYRSIVSSTAASSSNQSTLTPLQAVVTSSTISSPTGGFNEQPPADLFDSEDGDALSVATTTETPTPPPSLNGDLAIKSMPEGNSMDKVVVIKQPQPASEAEEEEDEDLPFTSSLLPSNRFHGQLTSIPKGWLRKVVTTSKGFQQVFYYNPVGKRFSGQEEIDQYFARLGYSVPMSLFNFELPKLVDEDEDDDLDDGMDDAEEMDDEDNMKTVVVKVTSNAKGEATVVPTTSTVVALPSGTVVTRADTTVETSMAAASTTTSRSLEAASGETTLVTSSKSHMAAASTIKTST